MNVKFKMRHIPILFLDFQKEKNDIKYNLTKTLDY